MVELILAPHSKTTSSIVSTNVCQLFCLNIVAPSNKQVSQEMKEWDEGKEIFSYLKIGKGIGEETRRESKNTTASIDRKITSTIKCLRQKVLIY